MDTVVYDGLVVPPLAETFASLAARSPYFTARTAADGEGWISARAFLDTPSLIAECVRRVAANYETTDLKIAGSFFLLRYTWIVGVGVIGAYLAARRVPCFTLNSLLLHFGEDGYPDEVAFVESPCALLPDDPRRDDPSAIVVPDLNALQSLMRATVESHCAALITALRPHTPLNARALWGLATDRHAQIFLTICMMLGDAPRAAHEMRAWTGALDSLFSARTEVACLTDGATSAWTVNASGCCLAYKLPDARYCAHCPLLPAEERMARVLERNRR